MRRSFVALLAGLRIADRGSKEDNMIRYLDKTRSLIQGFVRSPYELVPRGDNKKADALNGGYLLVIEGAGFLCDDPSIECHKQGLRSS
ncbi:hypothetical protein Tco_0598056 [Tanacetum coccineum]